MTEILYYECDVCRTRMPPSEALTVERQLGEMLNPEKPDEHLCIECFDSLKIAIMGWVHRKNE